MREHLSKAKRVDNGEWVEGGYHKHIKRQTCPIGDELKEGDICYLIIRSGFADWNMTRPLEAIEVDPETVCEYTGLPDKNGVKIFEKHIIQNSRGMRFVVTWDDENARFIGRGLGRHKEYMSYINKEPQSMEVIGNVFDNPELFEV